MSYPPTQSLVEMLEQDTHASNELLRLLDSEQEALKHRTQDALTAINAEKQHHLHTLERNAAKRAQWLQTAGLQVNDNVWQRFLESIPVSGLTRRWQALQAIILQCQQKNDINGKMIARGQQVMNRLLSILRGQETSPGLYTQSGSAQESLTQSYTMVKA